jgi:hypothetical protein
MTEMAWKVAREWGIFAAMCVFFIYASWVRENSLTARIERNEEFVRQTMLDSIKASTAVMSTSNAIMERLERQYLMDDIHRAGERGSKK